MRADGSDNVTALTRTLSECAGRTIHIPHGTYTFSPQGYAQGFTVPAGTTLVGDGSQGSQATVLQVADSGNFAAFLWVRNVSNVRVRRLRFEGTHYDSGCSRHLDYGHAIYLFSDAGKPASVESVEIADSAFHNFNGQSWVTLTAADGSPGMGSNSEIAIRNNLFVSDANLRGGCAASGGIGYPVAMVWLHGSDLSSRGLIANVSVASNTFNAGYVKSAITIWSGTNRISVQNNTITDAGLMLAAPPGAELGRYAISIYNSAHDAEKQLGGLHPDTIAVIGNTISNPYSAGIYVASAQNLEITGNRISGQRDRNDATLPKGAIALNHAASIRALKGNELSNNYIGISSVGTPASVEENKIVAAPGGRGTKIVP
jgi:hypothetical protein